MKLLYLVCFGEAKEDDFIFGNLLKGCPSRVKLKLHFWWCLTFSSQTMRDVYSPNNVWAQFQPGSSRLGNFKDWLLYGKHIENLCTGLPLYQLVATERKSPIRALWLCLRAPPPLWTQILAVPWSCADICSSWVASQVFCTVVRQTEALDRDIIEGWDLSIQDFSYLGTGISSGKGILILRYILI